MTDPAVTEIDAPAPPLGESQPLPERAVDYLDLDSLFSAEELALRASVREFVDERIRPFIADWY